MKNLISIITATFVGFSFVALVTIGLDVTEIRKSTTNDSAKNEKITQLQEEVALLKEKIQLKEHLDTLKEPAQVFDERDTRSIIFEARCTALQDLKYMNGSTFKAVFEMPNGQTGFDLTVSPWIYSDKAVGKIFLIKRVWDDNKKKNVYNISAETKGNAYTGFWVLAE